MDCRVGWSCLRLGEVRSGKTIVEQPGTNSWLLLSPAQPFDILGMTVVETRSLGGMDGGESLRRFALNDRRGKPPKSSGVGGGLGVVKVWTLFLFQSGNEKKLWWCV